MQDGKGEQLRDRNPLKLTNSPAKLQKSAKKICNYHCRPPYRYSFISLFSNYSTRTAVHGIKILEGTGTVQTRSYNGDYKC